MVIVSCFFYFPASFLPKAVLKVECPVGCAGNLIYFPAFGWRKFCCYVVFGCYIVIIGCYWLSYKYQVVHGQMLRASFFLDVVQSIFVTTVAVGLIVKVQAWMQKQQDSIVEEKNKLLVEVTQKAKACAERG